MFFIGHLPGLWVSELWSVKAKVMEPKQATHWQSMYCFKNIKNLGYWDNIRGLLLDVYSPPYAKKTKFFGVFWAKIGEILLIFGHFLILDQNVR